MILRLILIFGLIILFSSCSKKELEYEPSKFVDPYKIYEEGYEAFKKNDFFFASKKFLEAEINFKKPRFAAKSSIMASFSFYGINFYIEAEENLNRYLKTYPADQHTMYAHYLLAIIFYEQISDEKKDLQPLIKSRNKIDFFLEKYPNSEYAIDLTFKRDLVQNQLAAKELYIAKYYISVKKWIPAINRLKIILDKYSTTIFVEEALHRLVEIYYHIGLESEAKNYASVLGYNYNSSEWFKKSYKVLNKDYKIFKKKIEKDKKDRVIKKILRKIK